MSLSHSAYTMLYSLCKQPILGHTRDIKVNNISAIERADMCVLPGGSQVERALILSVDTETAFLTDFTGEVDNFVRSNQPLSYQRVEVFRFSVLLYYALFLYRS
jgi:hypothetical protein